jgi:hypothetical protein
MDRKIYKQTVRHRWTDRQADRSVWMSGTLIRAGTTERKEEKGKEKEYEKGRDKQRAGQLSSWIVW